jgi:DNA-binding SARP family transcriptional activator
MGQELRVRVLGATELAVDGRPLVGLASAKATALLVYLAVTGTAQSRSALAGLLWSDLPEATARANLRLALTKLRRALPAQLLVTRQTVALDPARPVWVDAVEVERLVAGKPEDEELLAATRLCRGEFLSGFEAPGAELFDEWVLARRAASRADQLALLDRAVQDARDRGDTPAGVEAARRMLELEPLHEEAHRALMWFLATGGQRARPWPSSRPAATSSARSSARTRPRRRSPCVTRSSTPAGSPTSPLWTTGEPDPRIGYAPPPGNPAPDRVGTTRLRPWVGQARRGRRGRSLR